MPLYYEMGEEMKKALMFGAGNIGRGFIGGNLALSGYETVFCDVVQSLVDLINSEGKYRIHIMDRESREIEVSGVRAVNSALDSEVLPEIASCDLITTAVGPNVLPKVGETLAKGLKLRREHGNTAFLNIICCENGIRTTSRLKKETFSRLSEEDKAFCEEYIGFPDCAVDRISPKSSFEAPLDAGVEAYMEWDVERSGWKGPEAEIIGLTYTDKLMAMLERKLFTLNSGHAILAYLGYISGYNTVLESASDPAILKIVRNAMYESGEALIREFGFEPSKHYDYIETILKRFKNPKLTDEVVRVGREPLRKLGTDDRLLKPIITALGHGLPVDNLLFGVSACLYFDNPDDPESETMQERIAERGAEGFLREVFGLGEMQELNTLSREQKEALVSRCLDIFRALSLV